MNHILIIHGDWVSDMDDFETERYDDYYTIDTVELTLTEALEIVRRRGESDYVIACVKEAYAEEE